MGIFNAFLSSADFVQIQLFLKILQKCQTDWIQIRPDVLSGLIWVQSVCKGYEQTNLGGIELNQSALLQRAARLLKFCR